MIKTLLVMVLATIVAIAIWCVAALILSMSLARLAVTTSLPALDWSQCMWLLTATAIMGGTASTALVNTIHRSSEK